MDASLQEQTAKHLSIPGFKSKQVDAITALLEWKDVLCILPTGYG